MLVLLLVQPLATGAAEEQRRAFQAGTQEKKHTEKCHWPPKRSELSSYYKEQLLTKSANVSPPVQKVLIIFSAVFSSVEVPPPSFS